MNTVCDSKKDVELFEDCAFVVDGAPGLQIDASRPCHDTNPAAISPHSLQNLRSPSVSFFHLLSTQDLYQ